MRCMRPGDICDIHRKQRVCAPIRLKFRRVPSGLLFGPLAFGPRVPGLPRGQLLQRHCDDPLSLGHATSAQAVVYCFAVSCSGRYCNVHSNRQADGEEMSSKHHQYQYARPQRGVVPPQARILWNARQACHHLPRRFLLPFRRDVAHSVPESAVCGAGFNPMHPRNDAAVPRWMVPPMARGAVPPVSAGLLLQWKPLQRMRRRRRAGGSVERERMHLSIHAPRNLSRQHAAPRSGLSPSCGLLLRTA